MIDPVDLKYFKLVVGRLKKETPHDCATNCISCGDKKSRLHLYKNEGMDQALVHCYNAGCVFDEQQMGMVNFLKETNPSLLPQYKKERFKGNIEKITQDESRSLNDILAQVTSKTEGPKEIPKKEERCEPAETPKKTGANPPLPKLFTDMMPYAKDCKEAVDYINGRKLEVADNWLFSRERFIKIFDKDYFVEDFLMIPLFQNGKLRGFYTRSINEKRFSTIVFPKGEKYWASDSFNPDETVYIFEGIMDALSSGLDNTVAMLSADLPQELLEELKDPVFCLDNDETGVKKALKYNKLGYKTFVWPEGLSKDLNEILKEGGTKEENKKMLLDNIFQGVPAVVRLNLSRK